MPEMLMVRYRFLLPHKREESIDVAIDAATLDLITPPASRPPEWARLSYHQCPNCILSPEDHPYCPLCAAIAPIVGCFETILSCDEVDISVETGERQIIQHTTVQRALGSLMGLIMAVSGCPHMVFFKPMARFHLPFATEEETVYRAASMYMLAQYYIREAGGEGDCEMKGLKDIYLSIQQVNAAIATRLRSATLTDSSVNAVIMLDMYARSVPYNIDESMEAIRYLFREYMAGGQPEAQGGDA